MTDLARQFTGEDHVEWKRHVAAGVADLCAWLTNPSPPIPATLTHTPDQNAFYRTFFRSLR